MAIHLHTHSYYSFLHGITSPAELAEAAARAEMPALALTEAGTLAGAIEVYEGRRAAGGEPVPGAGLQARAPAGLPQAAGALVLLAMELSGWSSLCRLSSCLQMQP